MNLREAAQRALDALEFVDTQDWSEVEALRWSLREHMAEIHRLRAALAEDVPEANMVQVGVSKMETVKPVAWNEYPIDTDTTRGPMLMTVGDTLARAGFIKKPKPLTEDEIDKAWRSVDYTVSYDNFRIDIARAIERAHGIEVKNE